MNLSKKDLLAEAVVNELVNALGDYNHAVVPGTSSFRQWQVSFAKYDMLVKILRDSGHQVQLYTESGEVEHSYVPLFRSVEVDGKLYFIAKSRPPVGRALCDDAPYCV